MILYIDSISGNVITQLVAKVHPRSFHLLAHSLGSMVLATALDGLREDAIPRGAFANIVLEAADLDPQRFEQVTPALARLAQRITLYVSHWDGASAIVHSVAWPENGIEKDVLCKDLIDL